jgi:hypothetical protein
VVLTAKAESVCACNCILSDQMCGEVPLGAHLSYLLKVHSQLWACVVVHTAAVADANRHGIDAGTAPLSGGPALYMVQF